MREKGKEKERERRGRQRKIERERRGGREKERKEGRKKKEKESKRGRQEKEECIGRERGIREGEGAAQLRSSLLPLHPVPSLQPGMYRHLLRLLLPCINTLLHCGLQVEQDIAAKKESYMKYTKTAKSQTVARRGFKFNNGHCFLGVNLLTRSSRSVLQ